MAAAPFDWTDYLRLANQLSQNADEASQRASISRAYYSMFHAATIHAQVNGFAERSHGRLWKMYQSDPDVNCRRLSVIGNAMKRAREDADYVTSVPRVADVMAQQLIDANRFIATLAAVPTASPQPLPPTPKKVCLFCAQTLPF
jgi:uncharacterized protein (UPF0332 family)